MVCRKLLLACLTCVECLIVDHRGHKHPFNPKWTILSLLFLACHQQGPAMAAVSGRQSSSRDTAIAKAANRSSCHKCGHTTARSVKNIVSGHSMQTMQTVLYLYAICCPVAIITINCANICCFWAFCTVLLRHLMFQRCIVSIICFLAFCTTLHQLFFWRFVLRQYYNVVFS